MFESWPFTNFHDMNLDWIVDRIKNVETSEANAKASEEAAKASEEAAKASEEAAKTSEDNAEEYADRAEQSAENIQSSVNQIASNTARIDNLIANAGDGTTPSELVDMRVGYDGITYSTAGEALRAQAVGPLRDVQTPPWFHDRAYGVWNTPLVYLYSDGTQNRVVYTTYIPLCNVKAASPYQVAAHVFDKNKTRLGVTAWASELNAQTLADTYPGAKYLILVIQNSSSTLIDLANITDSTITLSEFFDPYQEETGEVVYHSIESGTLLGTTGKNNNVGYGTRLRTSSYIPVESSTRYALALANRNMQYALYQYTNNNYESPDKISNGSWVDAGEYIVFDTEPNTQYIRMVFRYSDDRAVTAVDLPYLTLERVKTLESPERVKYSPAGGSSYPIVRTKLGSLGFEQSFVVDANGNYISFAGTNYTKQDSEFNTISTGTVTNLSGHSNSAQMGEDGYIYLSGWNDNTVYKVDPSTMTVTEGIALPFEVGEYTSCGVDTVNKLIYCIHSAEDPSTDHYYKFTVYKYDTHEVLRSHTIPILQKVMQSVVFHKGRLYVTTGSTYSGQSYRVYDTAGTVIGEYFANITGEPECMIPKDDKVLVLYLTKELYEFNTI